MHWPWTRKASPREEQKEKQLEPTISSAEDWSDANDPEDPHNWPLWKRLYHTYVPTGFGLVASFGSSVYTAGIDNIEKDLHTSAELARLGFVLYVLGMAVGAPLAAPASETLGRRWVYWICLPLFSIFVLGTGLSHNITAVCVTRFFTGVFASPFLSLGTGTISDVWSPKERSVPMAAYLGATLLGPALGPMIGGFVVTAKGWRWTSWAILFFVVAILIPSFTMSETYKQAILKDRAKRLSIPGPPNPLADKSVGQATKHFLTISLKRPLAMLFTEPVTSAISAYVAFNFAVLYSFFTVLPYVYETVYDFSLDSIGLTFFGIGVGICLGAAFLIGPEGAVYRRRLRAATVKEADAVPPPESRLVGSMFGGPLICVSLFLFAWTAQNGVFWIVPVIAEAGFAMGFFCVFASAMMFLIDFYGPLFGASAVASGTLLRYIAGTAFPLFVVQMYEGIGIGWATSLIAFISAGLAVIPYVLYYQGPKIRQRSSYTRGEG